MKWKMLIGLGTWMLLTAGTGSAQRIPIREEPFEVYEKEVMGFEWILPAEVTIVRDSLTSYLSRHTDRITVFEDMILVESVRYAPVSIWQPVTLIYLIDSDSRMLTRIRAGSLINHQESITVRSTPDLAIRFLLDLDQMTRYTTGDSLDFDLLVQHLNARDLLQQYHARTEAYKWNLYVDRRPEEVVEQTGLTLRNPAAFSEPTPALPDQQIVEEISLRFQQYVAASDQDALFLQEEEVDRLKGLQDSIRVLNLEIVSLKELQNRGRQEAISSGARADTIYLRDTVTIDQTDRALARQALLEEENDQLRERLKEKDRELEVVFSRLSRKEQELSSILAQKSSPAEETRTDELRPMRDSLLRQELMIRELTLASDSLEELLLILQPESEAARARRAVYLRQQLTLSEARRLLVEESLSVSAREKRVSQRERFLADQEESVERDSLLRRITALENALIDERRILSQEPPPVRSGTIRTEGQEIPRLSIRSELPASWTQEQLLGWLRTYELPYTQEGDRFQVRSGDLPGMGEERYEWEITISARDTGSVIHHTFRQSDGSYLDLRSRTLESLRAARMIQDIFR